ncbi:MAG: phosphoglucosamine mutase [Spirochaetota bacterium]
MPLMVSVSGVRGIVGKDLTPPVIEQYLKAFLRLLGKTSGKVLVGRDTRKSGTAIQNIVQSTVLSLGYDVVDIGVAATPTVLFNTRKLGCIGGIAITASHNPHQWNALKFCTERGLFLDEKSTENLKLHTESIHQNSLDKKTEENPGVLFHEKTAGSIHIQGVMGILHPHLIPRKKLRVAVDPGGGAASEINRSFLEQMGCEVFGINETAGSRFPRGPEPVPRNLHHLEKLVKDSKADVGFAQDPDGDRLSVVAETAQAVGEEYTLVLAGESFLRNHKTDIACNLSTSMMMDDLAGRFGVKVYRTKIGEIHVTRTLLQHNLGYGGEGNGGVIVPEVNPCRDSILGMGLILELLAGSEKSLSQIIKTFPAYVMKKYKFPLASRKLNEREEFYHRLYSKCREYFSGYRFDTQDGVKIYSNTEWLHIRRSNTEPVVRITSESKTHTRSDALIEAGKSLAESI